MKSTHLIFALALAPLALSATQEPSDPARAYEQAVSLYVTSAGDELKALRAQGDALTKDLPAAAKARFADFYAKLELCEQTHGRLRRAVAKDFDALKARYEKQRGEALAALAAATGG